MNIIDTLPQFNWLKLVVGKTLCKTQALIFFSGNSEVLPSSVQDFDDLSIDGINLEFEGVGLCRIFGGSDGSSICLDHQEIESFSMDEYGEEKICNLSSIESWAKVMNKKVAEVYVIESEVEKCIFAIEFKFENKFNIVIANLGDNLIFTNRLDDKIIAEENARLLSLN